MKFAHMGDCHLGGWRQPELKMLNFLSFKEAVNRCIKQKVDFILITGDLFDSAYPPIEILKETFGQFRRLKEENIPVFLIAGSHDYSVSGKSFLDVLSKSGFCKNVTDFEERKGNLILQPTLYKNVAIYGYPGKKSGLEVEDVQRIKLQDSPGFFKILMLHTAIKDAIPTLPIKSVNDKELPNVNYLALSHLHINYNKENRVYSGPIFPNNISELQELKSGFFYIYNNGKIEKEELRIKDVYTLELEITNALTATEEIISILDRDKLKDKLVILKLFGILKKGKSSDIDFSKIESFAKGKQAYAFLKSTSKLHLTEQEFKFNLSETMDLESQLIQKFEENNPSKNNHLVTDLIRALQIEKLDDEKLAVFEDRVISEANKIIKL